MTDVLIGMLVPALTVAMSPTPATVLLFIIMQRGAPKNSTAFLAGWVISLAIVMSAVLFVANTRHIFAAYNEITPLVYGVMLGIGVFLMLYAVYAWLRQPKGSQSAKPPKWVASIGTMTPLKSFGLGCFFAGLSPKNGVLAAASAVAISGVSVNNTEAIAFMLIFLAIGSVLIALPVIYFFIAPKMAKKLSAWAGKVLQQNTGVIAILLFLGGAGLALYAYLHL